MDGKVVHKERLLLERRDGPGCAGGHRSSYPRHNLRGIFLEAAPLISGVVQPGMRISFSLAPTAITLVSCTTPDATVSMGSYKAFTFTGVG